MEIEELAKEYANRHLDVSEELGCYLVKSVFLDGAEYQREKQDEFAIGFVKFINETDSFHHAEDDFHFDGRYYNYEEFLEIYKKSL